ncbi:MAG: hypothetical protein JM58_07200 [Peptococcaceae bacterium BICA1-8]|nr:MAG: hypothetical protein JM58_07200 [Peptococcaceae bacterium BICA1-8]
MITVLITNNKKGRLRGKISTGLFNIHVFSIKGYAQGDTLGDSSLPVKKTLLKALLKGLIVFNGHFLNVVVCIREHIVTNIIIQRSNTGIGYLLTGCSFLLDK